MEDEIALFIEVVILDALNSLPPRDQTGLAREQTPGVFSRGRCAEEGGPPFIEAIPSLEPGSDDHLLREEITFESSIAAFQIERISNIEMDLDALPPEGLADHI